MYTGWTTVRRLSARVPFGPDAVLDGDGYFCRRVYRFLTSSLKTVVYTGVKSPVFIGRLRCEMQGIMFQNVFDLRAKRVRKCVSNKCTCVYSDVLLSRGFHLHIICAYTHAVYTSMYDAILLSQSHVDGVV